MRKVKTYSSGDKKEMTGVAKFHMWGNKAVECFGDLATQTVAIVEFLDGSVKEVYPDCIEFINKNAEPEKIASCGFEHNDGDQIFTDTFTFYKNPDMTYKKVFTSGWDGKTSEKEVTLDEIEKEFERIKQQMRAYQLNKWRGGYEIYMDLQK